MENQLMVLPAEVAQIAENVSVEKRNEVQTVLNHVFNGVAKMREQLDAVAVTDENDKVNMKLANTIRLGVRQVRLDAEKTFDAKRAEVQQAMLSFKTEDSLWLKAKQTMQILTKEIEENARWKEETRERFEKEQHELKIQQRLIAVGKFDPEIQRSDIEPMSDAAFDVFLAGVEKKYNDWQEHLRKEEEARIELQKKAELHEQRKQLAIPYYEYWSEFEKTLHFGEQSESDFDNFLIRIKKSKEDNDAKIEQLRIDGERLRKEAKEKEEKDADERAKAKEKYNKDVEKRRLSAIDFLLKNGFKNAHGGMEAIGYSHFIGALHYSELATENELELFKTSVLSTKEKAELEIKIKAKEATDEAERKAKELADKKAANAPDKIKLAEFAKRIKELERPTVKSAESVKIVSDVDVLLEKVVLYITGKIESL